MKPSRSHGWLLAAGMIPATILLGRLTLDLAGLGVALAIPIWIFFASFVVLGGAHAVMAVRGRGAASELGAGARTALALAIPTALLASVLDCMGLAFVGCTATCGFLMDVWSPVMGVLTVLYAVTARSGLLVAASAASFLYLVPNCVCYNPINGPWIDLLGRSPACFAGSFGVTLLALGALRTGRLLAPSLAVAWLATAAMLAFFVGHHFYGYPW